MVAIHLVLELVSLFVLEVIACLSIVLMGI